MNTLIMFGKRIQSLREKRRLSQEGLEEITGINARYISAVECGRRNVTIKTLEKISKGLGIEIYELFLYGKQEETEQKLRSAVEKMLKETDRKNLQIYFDIIRTITTNY